MDYLIESFRASDPLRQGDVFRSSIDPELYGILITADCDITHGKHGNDLTLNVDEADFDIQQGVQAQRRMISGLYVGASRARSQLFLYSTQERRGPAKLLKGSFSNGTLVKN